MLALGTYSGGWRIIRTLGRKVIDLGPAGGLRRRDRRLGCAVHHVAGSALPISTTHTITSAIMGVGATKRLSAVRWGVAGNILIAWVLTFPAAGAIAVVAYLIVRPLF